MPRLLFYNQIKFFQRPFLERQCYAGVGKVIAFQVVVKVLREADTAINECMKHAILGCQGRKAEAHIILVSKAALVESFGNNLGKHTALIHNA